MIYQLYVQFGREYRVKMVRELFYMTFNLKADWLSNCQQTPPIFNVFLHSGPIHVLY